MRRLLAIALLALIPSGVYAQRGFSGAHFSGRSGSFRSPGFDRGFYPGAGGYYVPLYDSLFGNYLPTSDYSAGQPYVIVVQPQAAAPAPVSSPPIQPLTIEWRGHQYVQITGDKDSQAQLTDEAMPESNRRAAEFDASSGNTPANSTPRPAHNVVLIFRDGHREEVSNYTVADGFLYANSDYYTSGAWVRKVPVSQLDVAETVAANQSAGAAFRLPTAANEVVVGP